MLRMDCPTQDMQLQHRSSDRLRRMRSVGYAVAPWLGRDGSVQGGSGVCEAFDAPRTHLISSKAAHFTACPTRLAAGL